MRKTIDRSMCLFRRYKGFKRGQKKNSSRLFIRNTCAKLPSSVQDKTGKE